jgi:hypothetical protein
VLHRTKVGQALAAAAFLAATGCQGGQNAMPSLPLSTGMAPNAVADSTPDKPVKLTLKLSVKTLAFTAAGVASAKKITVTEKGYTGAFKIASTCGTSVTIASTKPKGPKATITVTPVTAIASCTLTVKDTKKHKASATISVTLPAPPALNVNPATLSFDATGASYASTFAVTQTGTGAFKETDTCSGIASVAAAAWSAPSATATVTPQAAGTCNITITDAYNQTKVIAVSVTTSGIIIQ